jgi:hypothetical protein
MTSQGPCPRRDGGGTGRRLPRRRCVSRMTLPRRRSGFSGLAIMSGHRSHMGSHSPGGQIRVLVADGEVDARVLAKFPLAETLKILIEAGASLEHRLPQSPHHRNKDLVVSSVTNCKVKPHALRGWRVTLGHGRLMRAENRLELANLSICTPLTGKTGNLDLDDLPGLKEIVSHTLIDRGSKGSKTPFVRRRLGNEHSLPVPDFDFAEQLKAVQSLAKRGTPDSQLRSQVTLRRNTRPFWQAANYI